MANENIGWQLEDFVDSLVVDLDKTRETLAIKAINKPLSYSVKEVALDLNIFPSYDGDQVKFITAQPGQQGASKVTIQLNSITDQQVRATTKAPGNRSEVQIADIDVDKKTRQKLRKLGVSSVEDLKQIENKNIDVQKVGDNEIDYLNLANQIQKSRRGQNPPRVTAVSLSRDENQEPYLLVEGENLAMDPTFRPVAVVNQALAEVLSSSAREMKIQITGDHKISASNEIIMTFDPYAIVRLNAQVS